MSGVIGSAGEYGAFGGGLTGLLLTDNAAVKQHLETLTEQAGDGLIAQTYAGLGSGTGTALTLQPDIAHQQVWQNDIAAVTGQMTVAQTALAQISSIASTFYADTDNLNGLNPSETDSIASDAQGALQQVAGLLDSTDGTQYVFAGQDSENAPVPNSDGILTSGFYTQIQTAVAGLAGNGGAATIAATLATASSNAAGTSPFSQALSQSGAALSALSSSVSTGDGQQVQVGILASGNASVTSTGTSTTGSYMRDIMRALATLGSLSSSQASTSGYAQVVADTRTSLGNAITALNQDAGVMGDQQAQLQTQSTTLSDTATALQTQLSGAEDVDMTKTLSQLTQTQTQLQASYQLIAGLQSLSLAKFLPAP